MSDQICDGVLVLPDGEPREFNASGTVTIAGDRGIESTVNVLGNLVCCSACYLRGIVVRHRFIDVGRKLRKREFTMQGCRYFFCALTVLAVTAEAMLLIDRYTRLHGRCGGCGWGRIGLGHTEYQWQAPANAKHNG